MNRAHAQSADDRCFHQFTTAASFASVRTGSPGIDQVKIVKPLNARSPRLKDVLENQDFSPVVNFSLVDHL